jgi:hypothetical protein
MRSYLNKVAAPVYKTDINSREDSLQDTLLPDKVGTNFADNGLPLGRYSSHAGYNPLSFFLSSNQITPSAPCSQMVSVYVRFEVFTAVTMKNGVVWDVTPCGSCKNRRFGGT